MLAFGLLLWSVHVSTILAYLIQPPHSDTLFSDTKGLVELLEAKQMQIRMATSKGQLDRIESQDNELAQRFVRAVQKPDTAIDYQANGDIRLAIRMAAQNGNSVFYWNGQFLETQASQFCDMKVVTLPELYPPVLRIHAMFPVNICQTILKRINQSIERNRHLIRSIVNKYLTWTGANSRKSAKCIRSTQVLKASYLQERSRPVRFRDVVGILALYLVGMVGAAAYALLEFMRGK